MTELSVHKNYILTTQLGYRYIIKDVNDGMGCSGLTILYEEKEENKWMTRERIIFDSEHLDTLIQILTEIQTSPLTNND